VGALALLGRLRPPPLSRGLYACMTNKTFTFSYMRLFPNFWGCALCTTPLYGPSASLFIAIFLALRTALFTLGGF
jgi:hypothetical protein